MTDDVFSKKHFCILPWMHVMVHQTGDLMNCCRVGELAHTYGSLRAASFDEIWNGEKIREMRLKLLNDEVLPQCESCHEEEAIGIRSLRQSALDAYSDTKKAVLETRPDGSIPSREIKYLGLRLSNECNLRCRSCSPGNSVSWYKDGEALSGKAYSKVLRPTRTEEELFEFLDDTLPGVRQLYFAGGEPLLQKEHYLLLEKLIETGRTNVHLTYNSNLTVLKFRHWEVIELWKKFPKVTVDASFDAVGEQAATLRKGSSWDAIERNLEQVRKQAPQVELKVSPTVSVMNAFHLPVAIERWIEIGLVRKPGDLNLNLLRFPRQFNLRILNPDERRNLKLALREFLDRTAPRVDAALKASLEAELNSLIRVCDSAEFWEKDRALFRWVTFKLDHLRKERFLRAFPEYFDLLGGE